MVDAKMYIVCPGRDACVIDVPLKEWEKFEKFVSQRGGNELEIPRAAKKLFIMGNPDEFDNLKAEWEARAKR